MAATMVLFNAGETMVKIDFAKRLARCRSGEKMRRGATKTAVCMSSSNLRYTSNLRVKCIAGENSSSSTVGRSSSTVGRSDFPKGFMFGAGSSAYQVEGAVAEGGREASIWDTFSHIPGNIADGSTGDIAVDQYNRYKDDVQLLKHLGMDSYRFSISWSRIFPKGSPRHGGVNEEGVAYYQNLITELLNNGIEPFVTLYHWDLPQILEDEYGGFLSDKVVEDFAAFAEECFRRFGDRVKYWLTINEPLTFATYGYDKGLHAPGRCSQGFGFCKAGNSATEPYIVTHNMLLAHSAAVKIYRTKYQAEQKGSIGIALVVSWMVPFSNSIEDQKAAQRVMDFRMGWYLDPLTKGDYPMVMRDLVGARLPQFTQQQSEDLAGSFDFLGYNYYTSEFTQHNPIPPNPLHTDYFLDACANTAHKFDRLYIGEAEGMDMFRSYPAGLGEVLNYTKNRYNNPPIYITETGYGSLDDGTNPAYEALNDLERVKYHSEHLSYVLQGIREGVDIRGYMVWSFLDNFEWASGTPGRFGLYYVDYANDLQRIPRESANWFRDILKQ